MVWRAASPPSKTFQPPKPHPQTQPQPQAQLYPEPKPQTSQPSRALESWQESFPSESINLQASVALPETINLENLEDYSFNMKEVLPNLISPIEDLLSDLLDNSAIVVNGSQTNSSPNVLVKDSNIHNKFQVLQNMEDSVMGKQEGKTSLAFQNKGNAPSQDIFNVQPIFKIPLASGDFNYCRFANESSGVIFSLVRVKRKNRRAHRNSYETQNRRNRQTKQTRKEKSHHRHQEEEVVVVGGIVGGCQTVQRTRPCLGCAAAAVGRRTRTSGFEIVIAEFQRCRTESQKLQTCPPADLSGSAGGVALVQELEEVLARLIFLRFFPRLSLFWMEASAVEDVEGIVGEECGTVGWGG
ncbi:hypothetical protein M5K25_004745 [Dendrobium thyrsiflorum]|uniref:Uncharacterized protein n=1 Tax=Dendrobium thyrsiflorum TaxID=117978 RepID=A0ABD0VFP0_DENTH